MRARLITSGIAIALGFVIRMEAENWSSWTVVRDGVPYGMNDGAQQKAFEQLSYCLMYGGTAFLVLTAALPRPQRSE